jgi:nifR3 family TIM-barrel protein
MAKKIRGNKEVNNKETAQNMNFWQKIKATKKPFFTIAPMANVTDFAFREMFAKYGKPDVMWTEFVSADGLCSEGKKVLINDLKFSKKQKPIVAQLFSSKPEKMSEACAIVARLGFDGIDINMGCPDKGIEKSGAGASLMKNPELAKEIIEGARKGVEDTIKAGKKSGVVIPVSVKTRIGYSKIDLSWIEFLLKQNLPVLTVHLRTRREMSDVPAHWDIMPEIIKLRNSISPETLIIGNGDVESLRDAYEKIEKYCCDGIMVGRGIFGNPWFFNKELYKAGKTKKDISIDERLKVMLEHAKTFEKHLGKVKNFANMKKHFKAYVSGFDGAKELRVKLMESERLGEVEGIVRGYSKEYMKKIK